MSLKQDYTKAVRAARVAGPREIRWVEEKDLEGLPRAVRTYLRNCGVVGKPKAYNMHLQCKGRMRNRQSGWFPFDSEQYNFFDHPRRLFFMQARIRGIRVSGYHCYGNDTAFMKIRLLGIFPVASHSGRDMFGADTVTFLNDLCLFNPAGLTDKRLQWEDPDRDSPTVFMENGPVRVSATLYFDSFGNLRDFISPDRYDVNAKGYFPFSTPVNKYADFAGIRLPAGGTAIWHYPDGPFTYGEFQVESLAYNIPGHANRP